MEKKLIIKTISVYYRNVQNCSFTITELAPPTYNSSNVDVNLPGSVYMTVKSQEKDIVFGNKLRISVGLISSKLYRNVARRFIKTFVCLQWYNDFHGQQDAVCTKLFRRREYNFDDKIQYCPNTDLLTPYKKKYTKSKAQKVRHNMFQKNEKKVNRVLLYHRKH